MWNVFDKDLRTNNDLEGWHHSLNKIVGKHYPNIWYLLECLVNEQASTEVTLHQMGAGHLVARQRFKHVQARIGRLRQRYSRGRISVMELLSGVANNLQHLR